VRYGNEFNFIGADFDEAAGNYFAKSGGLEQACLVETLFYQR